MFPFLLQLTASYLFNNDLSRSKICPTFHNVRHKLIQIQNHAVLFKTAYINSSHIEQDIFVKLCKTR